MDFSDALRAVRNGHLIHRTNWNGHGMYITHMPGYPDGIPINTNTAHATGTPEGTICHFKPYLMLCASDGDFVPWTPSQGDVLADDWEAAPIPTV